MFARRESSERCGLCKGQMVRVSYNRSLKEAVTMQDVDLCPRCDLEPDPPVKAK